MFLEQVLKIEIDKNFKQNNHECNPCNCCYGKISIKDIHEPDFYEHFYMNLDTWSIQDYKHQWKIALEKIKTHKKSCFITNFEKDRLITLWPLYRVGKIVYIQNHIYIGDSYKKNIKNNNFTPESSLKFVYDRNRIQAESKKISEWIVQIK